MSRYENDPEAGQGARHSHNSSPLGHGHDEETQERSPGSKREVDEAAKKESFEALSNPHRQSSEASSIIVEQDVQRVESRVSVASRHSKISQAISKASKRSSKKSKREHLVSESLPISDLEKDIVGWESQDDPAMPLNFSRTKKMVAVWLLSVMTLMPPLSSSIIAPAISIYSAEFGNTSSVLAAMPVSIFLLGFAVGPLYLAPMCEIHGRAIVLLCSNAFFCAWQIGCGLSPTLSSLIVFRFLAGIGGSAPLTLGGGVIADMFPVEERGFAISIWTIGPTIGPSIAPLIGAFIAGSIGWRWAVWIPLIPATVATVIMAFVFPETNHRVLIGRKVQKLRKELGRPELYSCYETEESRAMSNATILKLGLLRPLKLLFLSPIITVISLYISFVYGTIYLMYNTVPAVFQGIYGWSTGVSGLAFISLGLGYGAGLSLFSFFSDRHVVRLTKANDGVYEPEMRLPTMVYFAIICPVTFFWYGWAAQTHAHWAVAVIGLFPLGVGIFGIWMPAQAYIVDTYPQYAASGIAAFTVLRSITAAFLPLAGPSLFGTLGYGWGHSLLGFICITMIPVPVFIHRYGAYVRKRWPVKL